MLQVAYGKIILRIVIMPTFYLPPATYFFMDQPLSQRTNCSIASVPPEG